MLVGSTCVIAAAALSSYGPHQTGKHADDEHVGKVCRVVCKGVGLKRLPILEAANAQPGQLSVERLHAATIALHAAHIQTMINSVRRLRPPTTKKGVNNRHTCRLYQAFTQRCI